jgi:hypothetical protein
MSLFCILGLGFNGIGQLEIGPVSTNVSFGSLNVNLFDASAQLRLGASIDPLPKPLSFYVNGRSIYASQLAGIGGDSPFAKFVGGLTWNPQSSLRAQMSFDAAFMGISSVIGYPIVRLQGKLVHPIMIVLISYNIAYD